MTTTSEAPRDDTSVDALTGASITGGLDELPDLRLRMAAAAVQARLFGRPQAPLQIGRYTVIEPLGEGGMGVVFVAHDQQLDRKVALKIARVVDGDPRRSARLLREAQALARLAHPNVVPIFEIGEVDDQIFLAMELIEGETLRAWLARGDRSWRAILRVLIAAGRGVEAAHAAGIVHRDFKPDNVVIGADGRPRVVDFGLASEAPEQGPSEPAPLTLTVTGALLGTPAYMAPEQFEGAPTDARTDQFSFCAVAWEALHGRPAFAGRDLASRREAVLRGEIDRAPAPGVPSQVRRLLRRGLAREPERRHPTMGALLDALERATRPRWSAPLAAVIGVGVVGALWVREPAAPEPAPTIAPPVERTPTTWPPTPGCPEASTAELAFNYVRTFDIGLAGLQAGYYNPVDDEVVLFSYRGEGRRVSVDGEVLGEVKAPSSVTSILDGAAYDPFTHRAILIDQRCSIAEVDPVTIEPLHVRILDAVKLQIVVCGAVAVGVDGHLYVASSLTDEVVVITRDYETVVRRFKVDDDGIDNLEGIDNLDGLVTLAGRDELFALSTFSPTAAIFRPTGEVVVPARTMGGDDPPLIGGDHPYIPDAVVSLCSTGELWVCEGLEPKTGCYLYAPLGGEVDSCACALPPRGVRVN